MGAWSIKVIAVLRRILSMTRRQPQEKCLVFSQVGHAGMACATGALPCTPQLVFSDCSPYAQCCSS